MISFTSMADFLKIVLADIVLSGDNALIIGMAAAGLSPELRRKAILFGLVMAAVLRIVFAIFATYLLHVPGLLFFGGLLLVWVCWRLYGDIMAHKREQESPTSASEVHGDNSCVPKRTLTQALVSITMADLSMSIDNVLAVAAIARENTALLVFGLSLAIALMGFCASFIVRLLTRFPAISWLGLFVLVYVALQMLWDGWPSAAGLIGIP